MKYKLMSRKKKSNNRNSSNNQASNNQDGNELMQNYIQEYAQSVKQTISQINAMQQRGVYNPIMGQDFTQNLNISPYVPTQRELTEWLKNPAKHQKALRDTSQFLSNAIMQYERSIKHFSSILTYRYDLRPLSRIPKDKDGKTSYLKSMDTCNNILQKLNIPYQFENIIWSVMQEGVKFCYITDKDYFMKLFELPDDYCYITGFWELGYTFAIDLTFFNRFVGLQDILPEMYSAYETFIKMRELGISGERLAMYQYYPVPVEKGWVFTFDPVHADASPPLKGVFKDALEILSYKDLLKQKTTLDTWKLIPQTIPYDEKSGKFIVEYKEAENIVNMSQMMMPKGVRTFATLFKPQELNFSQSQNMNQIVGTGETLYWRSVGINGVMMGENVNSALALKFGLEGDYAFMEHMYRQIENFVNFQLLLNSRTYKWKIKMYGNRYSEGEDIDRELKVVISSNAPIEKLYALRGYQPFEIDPMIDLEEELGRKDRLKPIISGSQMSGKDVNNESGRNALSDSEIGDAGQQTRDNDSNANALKS